MPTASAPSATNILRGRAALPALTGLRFFAAFYVVLEHSLSWLTPRFNLPFPVRIFLGHGYLAVCLFFLLSGFILAYTYQEESSGGLRRNFWVARFARIYPVYLLSLVLVLPFEIHNLSWGRAASVILMVQAWNPLHPEAIGAWNYPAWSLSVEAFFYLCFPFLQMRLRQWSWRANVLAAAVASLICILLRTPIQGLGLADPGIGGKWLPLPILRLPEFLIGMILGNAFVVYGSFSRKMFLTFACAAGSILLLSLPIGPWVSLVFIPFAILIYCLASSQNLFTAILSSPLVVLLGAASYSIYLLQVPVRDWVRTLAAGSAGFLSWLNAPLTPVVLILFSILVFRIWEEPMRHALRRRLARKV